MRKIKCLFWFHSPKEIGRAMYPFEANKTLIGMGCRYCDKKLSQGYLVDTDKLEMSAKEILLRRQMKDIEDNLELSSKIIYSPPTQ